MDNRSLPSVKEAGDNRSLPSVKEAGNYRSLPLVKEAGDNHSLPLVKEAGWSTKSPGGTCFNFLYMICLAIIEHSVIKKNT